MTLDPSADTLVADTVVVVPLAEVGEIPGAVLTRSNMLAYSVQQRVRDIGVRRALGATANDVLRLVIVNAARVIATGAAIGLALSALSGRLIETMLFGVRPLDLPTFAIVTVVLGVTAALSIAGPAWRAVRIDPAVALRNQ